MKLHFTTILTGDDKIEEKFNNALKENPELHMHLIKSFAHLIMLSFKFDSTDNIAIESFRAGKVDEKEIGVAQVGVEGDSEKTV